MRKMTRRRTNVVDETDPGVRLMTILKRNREKLEASLPPALLSEIAELQQQNQFDDDRGKTRKAMREVVEHHAKQVALQESHST